MNASVRLDLVGVGWPICLLEYQQRIHDLAPGAVAVVRIEDPDMADSIRQLARRQGDRVIQEEREGQCVCLRIRKHGPAETSSDQ